jgi:hypothetical protein
MNEDVALVEASLGNLVRAGSATEAQLLAASPDEIRRVESLAGRRLPPSYAHFLSRAGRGAGNFLVGSDFFYRRSCISASGRSSSSMVDRCSSRFATMTSSSSCTRAIN